MRLWEQLSLIDKQEHSWNISELMYSIWHAYFILIPGIKIYCLCAVIPVVKSSVLHRPPVIRDILGCMTVFYVKQWQMWWMISSLWKHHLSSKDCPTLWWSLITGLTINQKLKKFYCNTGNNIFYLLTLLSYCTKLVTVQDDFLWETTNVTVRMIGEKYVRDDFDLKKAINIRF